jgi:hypothetical protein
LQSEDEGDVDIISTNLSRFSFFKELHFKGSGCKINAARS